MLNLKMNWHWVTLALAALTALMATRFFFLSVTDAAGPEFGRHLATHGLWFYAHAGGGAVALITGAVQWLQTSRGRRSRWHWLIGRTYVLAIAFGGLSGLVIAPRAFGGVATRAGFFALAVAWLVTTERAFTFARGLAWTAHRHWMIRSYALTFAAVTLRIGLPSLQAAGLSFAAAYLTMAWLAWVPNLLIAEWLISRERQSSKDGHRVTVPANASVQRTRPAAARN